jgi:3'-phosphoadenosine 5'-phosphosulfate sulfotransferase (PAPS reductase)/FAD synthetase
MSEYPKRVLSLGAGVQSTALLLMMIHGEIPKADAVIFADTGWEPKKVYTHLEWCKGLMKENNMPFHIVSAGNIREDFLAEKKRFASMPLHLIGEDGKAGMIRRQCTAEYKLAPLMKKQRELAGLKSGQRSKDHRITTVIGISYDELQRMRDPAFSWIKHDYPLVDRKITREDCLKWCSDHGYQRPPRSACIGCPFKNQDEWRY